MNLVLVCPLSENAPENPRLCRLVHHALRGQNYHTICKVQHLYNLENSRILFAIDCGEDGVNFEYLRMLSHLRQNPHLLRGCVGAMLLDGKSELYTKSLAAELTLAANSAGCAFIGRPLVEGTGSLRNFTVQAQLSHTRPMDAYFSAAEDLVFRLCAYQDIKKSAANLLCLHASSYHVSNTMTLWQDIKENFSPAIKTEEIGLRNGTVADCSGCPYKTCLHFGEHGGCFYGGVINDAVFPALLRADAVMLICPNYNDALSANLTAMINRMTSIFRQTRFYETAIYAIVVSGYSGGDIVARQVISALNMNKSFLLPPHFAMLKTANAPGEVHTLANIAQETKDFAAQIENFLISEKIP